MIEVTDSSWKTLIYENSLPIIILYTVGKDLEPCITVEKYIDEILKTDFRVSGFTYDMLKNYRYKFEKHISGTPTLIGIKNQKIILSAPRVMTKRMIKEFIDKLVSSKIEVIL